MQDALQCYMDDNKMYSFEGRRGIDRMEKVMNEVCGYGPYNTSVAFFEDNPGAIEAVIEWIGKQKVIEWKDNLESLVGPDEDEEEFLEDFETEPLLSDPVGDPTTISREGWDG